MPGWSRSAQETTATPVLQTRYDAVEGRAAAADTETLQQPLLQSTESAERSATAGVEPPVIPTSVPYNSDVEEPKVLQGLHKPGQDHSSLQGKALLGLCIYSLSTFFTTAMSITAKLAGANGMPVMVITFFRGLVVLLLNIPAMFLERANPRGNRVGLLILRGFVGWASGASLYASVQYLPVSDATVLSFLSPVWVALSSPLLIKEVPSRMVWAVLPACIGGVLLVSQPTFLFKDADPLNGFGVFLGCLQAVISGSVRMVVRELRTEKPSVVIFYLAAMTCLISAACAAVFPGQSAIPTDTTTALLLLATGLFAFGNQTCMTHGLRYAKASTCTALSYLSIIWAELGTILLWGRYPGVLEITGAIIIGVCTALLTVFERRKSVRQERREAAGLTRQASAFRDDSAEGLNQYLLQHSDKEPTIQVAPAART